MSTIIDYTCPKCGRKRTEYLGNFNPYTHKPLKERHCNYCGALETRSIRSLGVCIWDLYENKGEKV